MRKSHFCILTKQLKACGKKSKLQENTENEPHIDKEERGRSRKTEDNVEYEILCVWERESYRKKKWKRKKESEKEEERSVSAFDRMLIKNFQSLPRRHKLGTASLV
jgi:hypothetical protein